MYKKFVILLLLISYQFSTAQQSENPVEYMKFLTDREQQMSEKYLSYMAEVAHGNRARKMEKKRQEVIAEIRQSLGEAKRLKPYKGDASLRDVFKNYWDILLQVFTEDYSKIVNMEEIAEQSYDNMEAYLLAQEKASEVLKQASAKIDPVYKQFAEANHIRLVEQADSKTEKKLRKVGLVNAYYHQLFLIFFKSFKQEMYVWDAFNRKDINGLEQNKNTLSRFAAEGLSKLDTIKSFEGDKSLINASRKVLEFYHKEAIKDIPSLSEFILKTDEFAKIKKAFDAKPANKRTQADLDSYNKSVNEMNDAINESNKTLNSLNASRQKVVEQWEDAKKHFMDTHVPRGA